MPTSTFAQLSFQLGNPPGAPNTVYTTTDPTANALALQIVTNTATTLTGGKPVPPSAAPSATCSLIYLDLKPLGLSPDEFNALTFPPAWGAEKIADTQVVCLAPVDDMPLGTAPASIGIAVGNFGIANPPQNDVNLTATYYHVQGLTLDGLGVPSSFKVLLQAPPDDNDLDLHEVLALTVPQTSLVCSIDGYPVVDNTLTLTFGPGPRTRTVPAGPNTAFVVSFVYADAAPGFGALCTPAQARNCTLGRGYDADNWGIDKGPNQQNPSWKLTPKDGEPIIGTGVQSTVSFTVTGLETEFQPGPTLMFVQYSGVPGYQDGSFTVLLTKVPHVKINSFTVSPDVSVLDPSGSATVTLTWDVSDGGTLTLSPYQPISGTSAQATITTTTTFTLSAQGVALENLGNVAFKSATATVMPVVNSFQASPGAIPQSDYPANVTLAWNVNSKDNVTLASSATGPDPVPYNPVGSVPKSLGVPQMMTLTPTTEIGPWQQRRLIVPAFTLQSQNVGAGSSVRSAAASPAAGIIAVSNPSTNTVTFISSLSYQPVGNPVSVGGSPGSLAFSPDGSLLYVANSGDGTVSVVQITATHAAVPYSFAVVATVALGHSPQQIAVSPDGSTIFVTVDMGSAPGALFVLAKSGLSYTPTSLAVGVAPRGVAVTLSGAQVFVANSGDNTVSMLGVTANGYVNAGVIANVGTKPAGLALTADGKTLLAASSGGNAVLGISVDYPFTTQPTSVAVGRTPQSIAVLPTGGYALVTNSGDGTVSLLRCSGNPAVVATAHVGMGPTGLAVAPHSGVALVCNEQGGNLSVVTLASYTQETTPLSCNGAITKVAVAPGGGAAAAWYDAVFSLQGPSTPTTGVWVYGSGAVTNQLAGTDLYDLAYSPGAQDGIAYAALANTTSVSILDASTFATLGSVTIPDKGGSVGRRPIRVKVSADGKTVFVLVRDNATQMSMVILAADVGARALTIAADVVLATEGLMTQLEVMPDASAAFAAGNNDIWVLQRQDSGAYQVNNAPIALPGTPAASTILPDGSRLFVITKKKFTTMIVTVDTTALTATTTYLTESVMDVSLNGIAALPDGSRVLATDGMTAGIRVFDAATMMSVQTISWTTAVLGPTGIAVAPDGSRIFVANENSGTLGIIDQVQPA